MADIILPLSQEQLYDFIRNGVAPSPQEIYALMLANFSDENQAIINSPGNPYGTFLLTVAVSTSATLGQVVETNSNLLWTDSSGDWLKKILYNFGTFIIPSTSTVVRIGFDINTQATIAAGTIFLDDLDQEFAPLVPFNSSAASGEIDLYSIEKGAIAPRGTPTPAQTISTISNIATVKTTLGREEETGEAAKSRLENAEGAKIFGTTTYVESSLLQQTDYVVQARTTQNNTNSPKTIQGVSVDANSIISIVRSFVDPQDAVAAIGSTIYNSIKGGQKLSQPPVLTGSLPAVKYSSGYADEAALNAAGYETDVASTWAVWSPDDFAGEVNIPYVIAQAQNIQIEYKVSFNDTISLEQRNALTNQLKVISLEQTPVFSQNFARIQIAQYYNAVKASVVDNTIVIDEILLSVVGDAGQQDKQSVISDLNKYLFLDGEIIDGTAITTDVTVTEV